MNRLEGKVTLITGAASGFGRSMAKIFSEEGAKIFAIDINEKVEELKNEINGELYTFVADVTNPEQITAAFDECKKVYGKLDVLCNNAGMTGVVETPLHEVSLENFDNVMNLNVRGAFKVLQEAVKMMLENGGGSIVNTGSIGGYLATPGSAPYIISKGAMVMLTKQAALEYAREGIRVNSINPGTAKTPLLDKFSQETLDFLANQVPIGRLAEPEEIARVALFLASDESSYITGQDHIIDGGRSTE
ncbi:SDR family oxidoreductase [Lederbergia sp. NSJ-179]|uniref:SDR family NAD(P)-dependent oxidoreductase n=1 Tax=Lederbergia sp. NSJ-179 TaxID=2931402 RepID=UPI001FD5326E|nr:SDR family oxidoreductase [Lederbergia sp. NSJ-179]MCJ7843389.1 SDR family oxidoreductase [Lederbergia sp. NSJ-179]